MLIAKTGDAATTGGRAITAGSGANPCGAAIGNRTKTTVVANRVIGQRPNLAALRSFKTDAFVAAVIKRAAIPVISRSTDSRHTSIGYGAKDAVIANRSIHNRFWFTKAAKRVANTRITSVRKRRAIYRRTHGAFAVYTHACFAAQVAIIAAPAIRQGLCYACICLFITCPNQALVVKPGAIRCQCWCASAFGAPWFAALEEVEEYLEERATDDKAGPTSLEPVLAGIRYVENIGNIEAAERLATTDAINNSKPQARSVAADLNAVAWHHLGKKKGKGQHIDSKPNAEKVGDKFTSEMVMSQLRYAGLLEVCRIRQVGFPVRKDFTTFQYLYGVCIQPCPKDIDSLCAALVEKASAQSLRYKVPAAGKVTLAVLFENIEGAKGRLGISEYSVGQTTLEQIFNQFAGSQLNPENKD